MSRARHALLFIVLLTGCACMTEEMHVNVWRIAWQDARDRCTDCPETAAAHRAYMAAARAHHQCLEENFYGK